MSKKFYRLHPIVCTNILVSSLLLQVFKLNVFVQAEIIASPINPNQREISSQCSNIRSFTVRVLSEKSGTGFIIHKNKHVYTVLTAAHVLQGSSYRILSPISNKLLPVKRTIRYDTNNSKDDLALLQFESREEFAIAKLKDTVVSNQPILVAGFPSELNPSPLSREFICNFGIISAKLLDKPMKGGYQFGYSVPTQPGMSGSPVIDEKSLEIIGIHGIGSNPVLGGRYIYKDGTPVQEIPLKYMRENSWAIPISAFLPHSPIPFNSSLIANKRQSFGKVTLTILASSQELNFNIPGKLPQQLDIDLPWFYLPIEVGLMSGFHYQVLNLNQGQFVKFSKLTQTLLDENSQPKNVVGE